MVGRAWGEEEDEEVLNGHTVSFWGDESVSE